MPPNQVTFYSSKPEYLAEDVYLHHRGVFSFHFYTEAIITSFPVCLSKIEDQIKYLESDTNESGGRKYNMKIREIPCCVLLFRFFLL